MASLHCEQNPTTDQTIIEDIAWQNSNIEEFLEDSLGYTPRPGSIRQALELIFQSFFYNERVASKTVYTNVGFTYNLNRARVWFNIWTNQTKFENIIRTLAHNSGSTNKMIINAVLDDILSIKKTLPQG